MAIDFTRLDREMFMRLALEEARLAGEAGELPIGAVITHNNLVVAKGRAGHNARGSKIAHAEMDALLKAERYPNDHAPDGCVIYTTVEPSIMCLGAIVMSNIRRIVYGLDDKWITPRKMMDIAYVRQRIDIYEGGFLEDRSIALFKKFRPQELSYILEGKPPK
jgi:tRNA(adenine34) deaminase